MAWLEQLRPLVSSPFTRFLRHWDVMLLVGMVLGLVTLGGYLAMPGPQYTLSLSPLPAGALEMQATTDLSEAATEAGSRDELQVHKRKHSRKKAKKPARPPVLNINTASLQQLDLLPGVGPKLAQRIMEYRKSHGPFSDVAQLKDVKGIGEKNFARMQPYIKL